MRRYNHTKEKVFRINGEDWTTTRLAEHCGISPHTARKRLLHYRRGEMTEDRLFRKGLMPPGGNYKGCTGNEDWRALGDKPRPCSDVQPGTWERAHIRDIEDRPKPRRYVKVNPREKQEPGVYYNPCRINL